MTKLEGPISILIADDSRVVRLALRTIFEEAGLTVVGEAEDGDQAAKLAIELKPRIVTMDLAMPGTDGLGAVEEIMATAPTRILVVTGLPEYRGLDANFEALSRGALELVPKPTAWPATSGERLHLVELVRQLAQVPVVPHFRARQQKRERARHLGELETGAARPKVVAIGASTGGPTAIKTLLGELPADLGLPVVVVQHMADLFASGFIQWLDEHTPLSVREAESGVMLAPGVVYVALRGSHVGITTGGRLITIDEPPRGGHRPSVDVLFESVAQSSGAGAIGVLLSGMGRDGAEGLLAMAQAGAVTLAQDEASCVVYGMPKAAVDNGAARVQLAPVEIARRIAALGLGMAG